MQGSGVDLDKSAATTCKDSNATSKDNLAKDQLAKDNAVGITQLAIDHIFNAINVEDSGKFLVTASYLQVSSSSLSLDIIIK